MMRQIRCKSCGAINRVQFQSTRRIPLCGNKDCREKLTEPSHFKILRYLILSLNYAISRINIGLVLSLVMMAVGFYVISGKHRSNDLSDEIGSLLGLPGIILFIISVTLLNQRRAEQESKRRSKHEFERARREFEESTPSNLPLIQSYIDDLLKSIGGAIPKIELSKNARLDKERYAPRVQSRLKNC